MRKIKVNKKEVEKKQKKIAALMQDFIKYHFQLHDEKKVLETMAAIAKLKPDDPIPAEKVASIYIDYGKKDDAEKAVDYLEEKFPPTAYRLFLRARVCDMKSNYGDCIKYGEKALTYTDIDLQTRLMTYNILGHAYRYAGDAVNSLKYYELSAKIDLSSVQNAPIYNFVNKIKRDDFSNFLFSLHNVNESREKIFEEICAFDKTYGNVEKFVHSPQTHPRHKKLRIGYISPDIRRHVVTFFSYFLYEHYDRSRFEVYVYARNKEDEIAQAIKKDVDFFRNLLFENSKVAAQKIKDDEIDILVDLSGHTANNVMDIIVYKPAPIIISGIGWFNTTGVKAIDYFMVDKYTDPVGLNEKFFSEKMLRLQHSHFCYMWHDAPSPVTPAPCVKNGYVTFVSFNNPTKITDEALRVWAKIVNSVPNSKLYLKGKAFRDEYGTEYMLKRIQAAGLSLDRLIYEKDETIYLNNYNRADIALDTFPYPGGGTTCDALYMGVPVITLVQDRHNSRFGYSLLVNCGLGELCAFSEDEYIQKAVDLANDWDRLRDYHLTIRRKMKESPVMNSTIYMGEIEDAYEKIFNAWINGEELPEFPQDLPPVTAEQAEFYYNRAMKYIEMEQNSTKKEPHNIYVKRALYYFEFAAQADENHKAEILLNIAECKKEILDYAGAYDAICKAGSTIYSRNISDFSNEFLSRYHKTQATLDLYNGNYSSAIDNYKKAKFDEKCRLTSAALSCLKFTNVSSEEEAAEHFKYQQLFENIQQYTEFAKPEGKIKIGYISADFNQSAHFSFSYGLIASHNRNKFEITCYSLNDTENHFTNLYKNVVDKFIDVKGLSYAEIAEKIHNDKINVLIDFSGHDTGIVLPVFAYKPAPVQVSGIGYMSTTGLKAMDYFITDEISDPKGEHEKYFTEEFIYLPCQICYAMREDVPVSQGAPLKKNNYPTFGTICDYREINDDMLNIWKNILDRVPNANLIMYASEFVSDSMIDTAYTRMKNIGFNMDRVSFRPIIGDYMPALLNIDVMLDSYPSVGNSKTLDSLYMGVPVVTFYGERRNTRLGLSLLKQFGLEGLAVSIDKPQDYIERAVGLVNDIETLDVLHKNLRNMLKKPLSIRTRPYANALEEILVNKLNNRW